VLRLELSKHEWLYGVTTKLLPQARTPKPEPRSPIPETRYPNPDTRYPKPDTCNPKPEIRYPNPDIRYPIDPITRILRPEIRSPKPEFRYPESGPRTSRKTSGCTVSLPSFSPQVRVHDSGFRVEARTPEPETGS
jgi:hypothetical protein